MAGVGPNGVEQSRNMSSSYSGIGHSIDVSIWAIEVLQRIKKFVQAIPVLADDPADIQVLASDVGHTGPDSPAMVCARNQVEDYLPNQRRNPPTNDSKHILYHGNQ